MLLFFYKVRTPKSCSSGIICCLALQMLVALIRLFLLVETCSVLSAGQEILRNSDFEQNIDGSNWQCLGCTGVAVSDSYQGRRAYLASNRCCHLFICVFHCIQYEWLESSSVSIHSSTAFTWFWIFFFQLILALKRWCFLFKSIFYWTVTNLTCPFRAQYWNGPSQNLYLGRQPNQVIINSRYSFSCFVKLGGIVNKPQDVAAVIKYSFAGWKISAHFT